ncbi:MAG: type II toxin-antitoxin system VapC family toxin [Stellaceae bacterium]
MYLLDTNVISELRRPKPHVGVVAWLEGIATDAIFVSAVTIGELQIGVENLREQDTGRAKLVEQWVDSVTANYNVLPMDVASFRRWAQLIRGQPRDLIADAMIAATALVHNLTVVTRNVRDFARFDVAVIDPFRQSP